MTAPIHVPAHDPRGHGSLAASLAAAAPAAHTHASPSSIRSLVIPDGELIILRIKPSLWMLLSRIWIVILGAAAVALNIHSRLGFFSSVSTRLPWLGWTFAHTLSRVGVAVLLVCLAIVAWRFLEWWNRIYVLTDRRLIIHSGVLRQTLIDAPLRRIQHVSLHRGVEQRAVSLGSLLFSTAGPFGEFAWIMISHPHQRLRIVRDAIERYARSSNDGT